MTPSKNCGRDMTSFSVLCSIGTLDWVQPHPEAIHISCLACIMAAAANAQAGGTSDVESDWCKEQRRHCERRCGGADKTSFE